MEMIIIQKMVLVKEYVHVNDLAEAPIKALAYLNENHHSNIINIGTGKCYSVKEIINILRDISHLNINYEISKRRSGDPAILIAKNEKAKKILNWQPKYDLYKIIKSAWDRHKNPKY